MVMIIGIAMACKMGNILRFDVTPKITKFKSIIAGIVLLLSVVLPFLSTNSIIHYGATFVMSMIL